MSAFSQVAGARASRPPRIVTLRPDHYADTYADKPRSEVAVGLRLVSERDLDTARAQAASMVATMFLDNDDEVTDLVAQDEAYNAALIRWAIAKATCDPNDSSRPFFDMAEDVIGMALTTEALRFLWDELILLHKGKGSAAPPATDEELHKLAEHLDVGSMKLLDDATQLELRKLMAYALSVLALTDEE